MTEYSEFDELTLEDLQDLRQHSEGDRKKQIQQAIDNKFFKDPKRVNKKERRREKRRLKRQFEDEFGDDYDYTIDDDDLF